MLGNNNNNHSDDNNGWLEYKRLVLSELKRLRDGQEDINDAMIKIGTDMSRVRIDIAKLQVKAGLWGAGLGAVTGAIPTFAAIVWYLFIR